MSRDGHRRAVTTKLIVAHRDFANATKTIHFRTNIYVKIFLVLMRRGNSRILSKYFGYTLYASNLHVFYLSRNIYLLTPWCRVLLEKLTGLQLVKKLPAFHWTRRFITAHTSVRHLSLSWASPIQYIYPHPNSWRYILILSIHLCLGLPSGLLPSDFPSKNLYTPLSSPIRATCPATIQHPITRVTKIYLLIN